MSHLIGTPQIWVWGGYPKTESPNILESFEERETWSITKSKC